eukprot:CAMPEP_0170157258 /NCGR_PEP_ID=MMETSP0033_2-20121228/65392_1 /TAXON_ID=195969 /ORGANISM="Dolichomastix tenuilepis, Strain CCMP3274" /LENGTH=379 /DNA_ID=CAMNT_0010394651 /DNA_START=68 /DNA_END=1203 /DNA_ORIENTATION=+
MRVFADSAVREPPGLGAFKLERYFAKHEFTAPHLLCCSDCEALSLTELLAMSDEDSLARYNALTLGYPESQGLPILREEVAKLYETVDASECNILCPEEGIYLTMRALLKAGDHMIVTAPGYESLHAIAEGIGAEVSAWTPREDPAGGFRFDVSDLEELIRPETKLVTVNFPHNPTGALPTLTEWDAIIDTVKRSGAHLFSDEMYRLLERDIEAAEALPSAADKYEKAIVLFGMSKTYSLPGLRIGWLVSHESAAMKRIGELKDWTTICPPAPSEVLALMGLRAGSAIIERNKKIIEDGIAAIGHTLEAHSDQLAWYEPQAGTVAFPKVTTGETADAFCARALEESGVLLLPSSCYSYVPDGAEYIRLAFGRSNTAHVA